MQLYLEIYFIFIVYIINKVIITALKDIESILNSSNLRIDEIDKPKKKFN